LHGRDSILGVAVGRDIKGITSTALYIVAVLAAFLYTWLSLALYVLVAILWLIPDRRIEKTLVR
jgi:hypothetical protein